MNRFMIIVAATVMLAQAAGAVVVSDTNIVLGTGTSFPPADYFLHVNQEPIRSNGTSILIDVNDETLSFVTMNLDEGSDWYLTSFGDEFMESTISSGKFPYLVKVVRGAGGTSQDLHVGYGDFYLGVNTGLLTGPPPPGYLPRQHFGWVHLRNTAGELTMLGNAMAYDEPGIVVGTTQVVPEPGAWGVLVGGMGWARMRRRPRAGRLD